MKKEDLFMAMELGTKLFFLEMILMTLSNLYFGVEAIDTIRIVQAFLFTLILVIITVVRKKLERIRRIRKMSFTIKRVVFAPLYILAGYFCAEGFGWVEENKTKFLLSMTITFCLGFALMNLIILKRNKGKNKYYTEYIAEYKAKLERENESE